MAKLDFIDSLIDNNSIVFKKAVPSWNEAISVTFQPLIKSKAVSQAYVDDVIGITEKYGVYYIITKNLAMPHAQSPHINKDAFSIVVFDKPISYNDQTKAQLWVGFAPKNKESHMSVAIPQIVGAFEDPKTTEAILAATNANQVITILKNSNYRKYLKKDE